MARLPLFGMLCFILGIFPLLALTFLSPGLDSEGLLGVLVFGYGVATLALLLLGARLQKWVLILAFFQVILLALVVFETFSRGALYSGT